MVAAVPGTSFFLSALLSAAASAAVDEDLAVIPLDATLSARLLARMDRVAAEAAADPDVFEFTARDDTPRLLSCYGSGLADSETEFAREAWRAVRAPAVVEVLGDAECMETEAHWHTPAWATVHVQADGVYWRIETATPGAVVRTQAIPRRVLERVAALPAGAWP